MSHERYRTLKSNPKQEVVRLSPECRALKNNFQKRNALHDKEITEPHKGERFTRSSYLLICIWLQLVTLVKCVDKLAQSRSVDSSSRGAGGRRKNTTTLRRGARQGHDWSRSLRHELQQIEANIFTLEIRKPNHANGKRDLETITSFCDEGLLAFRRSHQSPTRHFTKAAAVTGTSDALKLAINERASIENQQLNAWIGNIIACDSRCDRRCNTCRLWRCWSWLRLFHVDTVLPPAEGSYMIVHVTVGRAKGEHKCKQRSVSIKRKQPPWHIRNYLIDTSQSWTCVAAVSTTVHHYLKDKSNFYRREDNWDVPARTHLWFGGKLTVLLTQIHVRRRN